MGYGFEDPNAARATEDAIYVDGEMFKLGATKLTKVNSK